MSDRSPLEERYEQLRSERPRPSKRQLMARLAGAAHRLEVRDDAYRRLVADNGKRGAIVKASEQLVSAIDYLVEHPSAREEELLVEAIVKQLTAWRELVAEAELYHGALVE